MVGSLLHLVSLLDHDWYAAGGARLPDTPQGTADPLTTGYPHTYYILVLPAFFCRRVAWGSVPGGSSIPRTVREQRWSPLNIPLMWAAAGQDPSIPVFEWLILTIANFPAINFNGGLVEAGETAMMGGRRCSNAVVGHHNGTRSLSVVETAGISKPSTWEPHISDSPRVRVGGRLSFSPPRRWSSGDRRFLRENNRTRFLRVLHATREDHNETPPFPIWISSTTWIWRELFAERVPMLKSCPYFFRGRLRNSFRVALEERHQAEGEGDELAEERAWKLFALVPRMLMHRVIGTGSVGRDELEVNSSSGAGGRNCWRQPGIPFPVEHRRRAIPPRKERRGMATQERVQKGQVSRTRQELVGSPLGPKNEETLRELRERRPQVATREIPREVLDFAPPAPLELNFIVCEVRQRGRHQDREDARTKC